MYHCFSYQLHQAPQLFNYWVALDTESEGIPRTRDVLRVRLCMHANRESDKRGSSITVFLFADADQAIVCIIYRLDGAKSANERCIAVDFRHGPFSHVILSLHVQHCACKARRVTALLMTRSIRSVNVPSNHAFYPQRVFFTSLQPPGLFKCRFEPADGQRNQRCPDLAPRFTVLRSIPCPLLCGIQRWIAPDRTDAV